MRYDESKISFRELWRAINKLCEKVDAARILQAPNMEIQETSRGTILKVKPGKGEAGSLRRGYVVSISGDTLLLSSTVGGSGSITAYKPYKLRATTWSGETETINGEEVSYSTYSTGEAQTRTATIEQTPTDYEEDQGVLPGYVVGDEIIIADVVSMTYPVDVNQDARAWATLYA